MSGLPEAMAPSVTDQSVFSLGPTALAY